MTDKYFEQEARATGIGLTGGLKYHEKDIYNQAIDTPSRERIHTILEKRASYLREQVQKLDNLASLMRLMPDEVANALYPFIMDSLDHPSRHY